jgi:hypothetical protein
MKRSEMIDEIMCVLLAHSVTYPQFPLANLKEAAEEILAMQEKAGMLPPPDEVEVATATILYAHYKEKDGLEDRLVVKENKYLNSLDYSKSKLWELEDEEK